MPSESKKTRKNEDFSLISREKLLTLYAGLLRCRMLEDFVAGNLPVRRSGTRTSSAAAVAVCVDQLPGDEFAAPARDFLPAFVEGRSLALIFSQLRTSTAAQRARFASRARTVLATARKHHRNGNHRIVIVFGRPATGRQWQAMLRTATIERLPIIFVCKGQSHRRSLLPPRYLPAIAVDRDDIVALYRVASEGIAHARRGNGPTLIECIPWPPTGKQSSDAIAKMEAYLAQKGISPARRKATVTAEFASELARQNRTAKL
jgi:hypothetical protein